MRNWTCAYQLDKQRNPSAGSSDDLLAALRRGADLRIYTTFDWLDHMGAELPDQGLVEETIDLRVVYLLDEKWVAALTALRYPANAGLGFGTDPSLSFFMYNQSGQFGIARPYFENAATPRAVPDFGANYHMIDHADYDTASPSHNAIYEFNTFRWLVADDWMEMLAHDAEGNVTAGSLDALNGAFRNGCSIKVAVQNLCRDLTPDGQPALEHAVLVELGSLYNHIECGFLSGESLPLVRIAPAIPLRYETGNWNFGWILPRTDGVVFHLVVDPYSRAVRQYSDRYAMSWFAR